MAEPFVSEIRILSFNFPPKGWAQCDGQQMSIQQNQALYALIGNQFGSDGSKNFNLPDLKGRIPVCITNFPAGTKTGTENVTLGVTHLPVHKHDINVMGKTADQVRPTNNYVAIPPDDTSFSPHFLSYTTSTNNKIMNNGTIGNTGLSTPHDNIQPSTVVNFCIALQGIFPERS